MDYEKLAKDPTASPIVRGQARIRRRETKNKDLNKIKKTWFEVMNDKTVVKKFIKENGNLYCRHYCKATKENLSALKEQGLL